MSREGRRVVMKGARRSFSRRFLALAGSARDFPYPKDLKGLKVENWRE